MLSNTTTLLGPFYSSKLILLFFFYVVHFTKKLREPKVGIILFSHSVLWPFLRLSNVFLEMSGLVGKVCKA